MHLLRCRKGCGTLMTSLYKGYDTIHKILKKNCSVAWGVCVSWHIGHGEKLKTSAARHTSISCASYAFLLIMLHLKSSFLAMIIPCQPGGCIDICFQATHRSCEFFLVFLPQPQSQTSMYDAHHEKTDLNPLFLAL